MSEKKDPSPEGNPPDPVDHSDNKDIDNQNEKVARSSYLKLLDEKKKMQEKLNAALAENEAHKSKLKTEEEKALAEQNRYKELFEQTKEENERLKGDLGGHQERWNQALKIDSFNSALGDKKIDKKYYGHIDIDKIIIDPETGKADAVSAQKEVERICREYPEIVQKKAGGKLPNEYPNGGTGTLSYDEWLKLPAKEMAKRQKEIKQ
jgi:hypothetical protein